jgi:hypothetical protein
MPNKKENLRLDEFVKQRISNYEPVSTSPDWSKMESLLGVVTKSESYSNASFTMPDFSGAAGIIKKLVSSYVFIALIMLAAGATIFYFILKSPSTPTDSTTNDQLPAIDTIATTPVTTNTVDATQEKNETVQKSAVDTDSIKEAKAKEEAEKLAKEEKEKELKAAEEAEEKKKALENEEAEKKDKEKRAKEEKEKKAKEEKKKEEKKKADKKEAEKKEKEKKAKEEKKDKKEPVKETLKKSNSPIGLGNLMRSVNLDSIKKQQEKQQEQAKPANDSTQR